MNTPSDFRVGERVELHPATDLWMRGARFGTVVTVGRTKVHVEVDAIHRRSDGRSRVFLLDPDNLMHVS